MPRVTRYSKISLQIIVAPDFATSSTSHYDWQGGFIGDTRTAPSTIMTLTAELIAFPLAWVRF